MVSLGHRVESADVLNGGALAPSGSRNSADSFGQQLSTAIEEFLNQSGGVGSVEVRVSEAPGQNSGGSQFLVTVTPADSGTTRGGSSNPTPPATPAPPATETIEQLFSGYQSPPASIASAAVGTGPITEADAYWAEQPAAVQALRNMPDGADKDALALSLANQGYTIDNQIMVMGWDPQTTMMMRQNYGYSWVPSYGQSAITVAPGVSDPYADGTYNPASPPPGSIVVTTAFAVGTIQTPDALLMQSEAAG